LICSTAACLLFSGTADPSMRCEGMRGKPLGLGSLAAGFGSSRNTRSVRLMLGAKSSLTGSLEGGNLRIQNSAPKSEHRKGGKVVPHLGRSGRRPFSGHALRKSKAIPGPGTSIPALPGPTSRLRSDPQKGLFQNSEFAMDR
jgi:hypothetical protein